MICKNGAGIWCGDGGKYKKVIFKLFFLFFISKCHFHRVRNFPKSNKAPQTDTKQLGKKDHFP